MPYSSYETPWGARLRRADMSTYICFILFGLAALFFTPTTIEEVVGVLSVGVWATFSIVGGIGALIGVMFRRYRWEWASLWALIGSIFIYVGSVWVIVFPDSLTRTPQAFALTIILTFLVRRSIRLSAHAAEQRLRMQLRGGADA